MSEVLTMTLCAEDRARLDKLINALCALSGRVNTPVIEVENTPSEAPKAQEEAKVELLKPAAEVNAPDRRSVKSKAVKLIQAGHKDEVKALIYAYEVDKIDLIPEDKLTEFVDKLAAIGG